jgi:hypothetical protein
LKRKSREFQRNKRLIRKKKCNVTYFIVKRTSNFKSLSISGAATTISPERGGIHPIYGVYLGGGEVEQRWMMSENRYRFSTQRPDEKNVPRVERGLTDARDKTTTLKFIGNLELDGKEGSENEIYKDQFVRTIGQLTRHNGHQAFYAVEDTGGIIVDVNRNLHLFSINDVIDSHKHRMNAAKTACTAFTKKQFKVVQTGYAPPFRSGSKLLLKLCGNECEHFNRQVYANLDLVKKFENKYKLSDPKSITTNTDYNTYRPIALIAWLQEEHTDFVTDHEWPALATKLPQRNNASRTIEQPRSDKRPDMQTCYKCHTVGHIAPDCPQKNGRSRNAIGEAKTNAANYEPSDQYEYKPMASWKYIGPNDLTKAHTDEDGKEWKFFTHCTYKATKKKGYFTLTHFDSEHKGDWKAKKSEANLTRIEDDPSGKIPLGPSLLTTLAPSDSDDVKEEDKMTFTGACLPPVVPVDDGEDGDRFFPEVYCCPT